VAKGRGILHRIRVVDAVDFCRLQQQVGLDLDGAQARSRVRREKRIARAGGEDRDASFFEVPHGATANVIFTDLVDAHGGHDAHDDAHGLE
jgi:hypothetical protein